MIENQESFEHLLRWLEREQEAHPQTHALEASERLPTVDLRTLVTEWLALKVELRKETEAAREIGKMLGGLREAWSKDFETLQIRIMQTTQQKEDLSSSQKQHIFDLIEAVDGLDAAMTQAQTLDQPSRGWFSWLGRKALPPSQALLEGLRLSRQKILKKLEDLEVMRISTLGQTFDPHTMECLEVITSSDGKEGLVLEEILAGYRRKEQVLRSAKVTVQRTTKGLS